MEQDQVPMGAFPTRHREAEARGVRLGVPLRVLGRVRGVDEDLMDRIGRAFGERDEAGAALADAIRMRAGQPGRVSMEQLRTALAGGVDAVPAAPPALTAFFAEVTATPDWVDWDLLDEGARVSRRLGQNAADVLTQLSLIGGYRFGGPSDLLVATGGLVGDSTRRRLGETQKWVVELTRPGSLRPGGEAWRLTVHVRAMHALVNAAFEPRWDVARWGLPINRADQASTLMLFDGVLVLGSRGLGVRVSRRESRALMHLWKYVGHLMGVDPAFLVDDEWERHRQAYHVLLAQADVSAAGPQLARAIVDAQGERHYPGWPSWLQRARARYERERLLSMLTTFLGPASMRDLGLPLRPPWAHAYLWVLNTVRYRVVGRTPWGRRRLLAWGDRVSQRLLDSYFRDEEQAVGACPRVRGVPERPEVPLAWVDRLREVMQAFPECYEETAWVGVRWRIGQATVCHLFGGEDQLFRITFRAEPDEVLAFEHLGAPYFKGGWGDNVVGMLVDDDTDWGELAELLTDSYCLQAPQRLAERVERPGA